MQAEVELFSDATWRVLWLGRVSFASGLARQEALAEAMLHDPGRHPDTLLLLEHDPVYTIGRTPDRSSLLSTAPLPYPVETIHRGGQATYHGPGQLIGYPIINLTRRKRDLHRYLRALEEGLIQTLGTLAITGERRAGLTGVWVGARKIASIGVGVRRWITLHGFALNVLDGDALGPFEAITPCGLAGVSMTAAASYTATPVKVESIAKVLAEIFPRILDASLPLQAAHQQEDNQDDNHQPQTTAGTVAPVTTMRPGGERSEKEQHQ